MMKTSRHGSGNFVSEVQHTRKGKGSAKQRDHKSVEHLIGIYPMTKRFINSSKDSTSYGYKKVGEHKFLYLFSGFLNIRYRQYHSHSFPLHCDHPLLGYLSLLR